MRKICAVTANRADFSRIETMLDAIKEHRDLELQLVVMGSHLLDIAGATIGQIKKKGFQVDRTVYMEVAGQNLVTMTRSVGLAIMDLATIFDELRPDIVLAPVDRYESFAIGSAAALMNIHVAHTQGGEVTGTIDESLRHALTKLSHMHFVATEKSRERVIKMGEDEKYVFNVGCPGTDLLLRAPVWSSEETVAELNAMLKVEEKYDSKKPFMLVLQHPVTTEYASVEAQMAETLEALRPFAHDYQMILLWPNIDAGSNLISKTIRHYMMTTELSSSNVKIVKHIPTDIFVNLMRHVKCFIGNSSSGVREACYFGTPVVNIGTRQSSRERGHNVIDAPNERKAIEQAIRAQLAHGVFPVEHVYGDGTAGKQFADICATIELPPVQKRITY